VTDLLDGQQLSGATAWNDADGIGSDTRVRQILLRSTGGVAWSADDFPALNEPRVPQVWRIDPRGVRRLASGSDVAPRSLRNCGTGRVCWRQGDRERRASLR
jgi:hypothetical protein